MDIDEIRRRFWSRVERRGDDDCWPWVGIIHKASGYGHFKVGYDTFKAHRVSYALTNGGVEWVTGKRGAQGLLVLHKCDNRRCVNPNHLFLGSQRDNMHDCSQKRRISHGEGSGLAKLTVAAVSDIKALNKAGLITHGRGRGWHRSKVAPGTVTVSLLARKHGVAARTIQQVLDGISWVGIGD